MSGLRLAADLEPGDSVKALSLWEPWASLMATGAKSIETRHWATSYRGPLLICAAARRIKSELWALLDDPDFQTGLADYSPSHGPGDPVLPDDLNFGHAVALVDLVRCVPTEHLDHAIDIGKDLPFGNFTPGRFGWITEGLRRLRPFPVKGHQRLFTVQLPDDLRDWR
jgi:hypothetical protein